jgi:Zn finger protein HypA/HybF involved in hydrogenase expression
MALKQDYEDYFARLRQRGEPITEYRCPDCDQPIMTRAAPYGEVWDTLATCPHCEGLHMKITSGANARAEQVSL